MCLWHQLPRDESNLSAMLNMAIFSYCRFSCLFLFQLWPLINTFIVAFQGNGNATGDWVGLDNFKTLLQKVNFTKQDDLIALNRVPSTDEEYEATKALKVSTLSTMSLLILSSILLFFGLVALFPRYFFHFHLQYGSQMLS